MANITLAGIGKISTDAEGRFSLNDFHRASGGAKRHGPSYWLDTNQAQEIAAELSKAENPALTTDLPVVKKEGRNGGTYAVREMIYAYAMWISAPFQLKVIRAFDALVSGDVEKAQQIATPKAEPKQQSGLDKLRIAQAMSLAEETAARICQRFPNLGDNGKQVVYAKILNPFVGDNVIALPRVTSNLLPAGKVGEILGVSGNMIGRLANQNGLKTAEYGEFRLDKSAHSDKQVESFHYNDKGVSALRDILSGKEAA